MVGNSRSRLNSGCDKNNILSKPPKTDRIKNRIKDRRHYAISNMVGAPMVLGMMLAGLQNAEALEYRDKQTIFALAVPPSVDLICLTEKQKSKPSVSRRIKAKAQYASQHRWNNGCVIAMPI